ncbi:MAG: hypothetical protein JST60_13640 [Chloroflexi bacterium SZAS-1]|jgi:4-hydroxy-tetrahydrodipicolinate reductase|nr:hypothetical protein [Chloroflexi bacterium SZAS-1]
MSIRVCLAGATGWAGSALARAIGHSNTIELVAATLEHTYAAPTCAALVREAAEVYRRRNLARR